jgi:hypothetical protein
MMIDGEGGRQRGLHKNSITRSSIRMHGWDYNQGSKMRVFEKPWTEEEWAKEIASGRVPSETTLPEPLRQITYDTPESGMCQISSPDDMGYRRFVIDDGSHRTNAMQVFGCLFVFCFFCRSVVYYDTALVAETYEGGPCFGYQAVESLLLLTAGNDRGGAPSGKEAVRQGYFVARR